MLQRHQDIQQNEDADKTLSDSKCSQNLSDYGDSSDEDNVIITINKTPDISDNVRNIPQPAGSHEESTNINDQSNENEISKSDSMIPLVGDSILAQDVTIDTWYNFIKQDRNFQWNETVYVRSILEIVSYKNIH